MTDDLRKLLAGLEKIAKAIDSNTKAVDRAAKAIEAANRRNAEPEEKPEPAPAGPSEDWEPEIVAGPSNPNPDDQ